VSSSVKISQNNGKKYFYLEQYLSGVKVGSFSCPIEEYNLYLEQDAMRSQHDHVALTWLLRDRKSNSTAAYMSLIADAIKLSVPEKEIHHLDYPFRTIPAMKIAKLAVASEYQERYKGIGSFMLYSALIVAVKCNKQYFACRFLTVDADVEHNEGVRTFYEKNGFVINNELYNKNRKTISMRKDIYL
jgi:ribosomal protein S18 acetylase RimI-like enzyme